MNDIIRTDNSATFETALKRIEELEEKCQAYEEEIEMSRESEGKTFADLLATRDFLALQTKRAEELEAQNVSLQARLTDQAAITDYLERTGRKLRLDLYRRITKLRKALSECRSWTAGCALSQDDRDEAEMCRNGGQG